MIINKTDPIIKRFVTDSQAILGDILTAAYLFGSVARNQARPDSDVDVLLLVKKYDYDLQFKISGLASDYMLDHGVFISTVMDDLQSWRLEQKFNTLFYQEIQRDGVRLC